MAATKKRRRGNLDPRITESGRYIAALIARFIDSLFIAYLRANSNLHAFISNDLARNYLAPNNISRERFRSDRYRGPSDGRRPSGDAFVNRARGHLGCEPRSSRIRRPLEESRVHRNLVEFVVDLADERVNSSSPEEARARSSERKDRLSEPEKRCNGHRSGLSRDNRIVAFDRYNVIKDSGGKQI